ncbi:MAG: LapA family protein [Gammaproteobacteria bacterium]
MRILSIIIIILLLIVGVSFAALNSEPVTINFYVSDFQIPLAIIVVATLGLGFFLGIMINFFKVIQLKRAYRQLKKSVGDHKEPS